MNLKQSEILNECLENIEKNTGTLLETGFENQVLTMNLISKSMKMYETKQLTKQSIIDVASICLCLLLQANE